MDTQYEIQWIQHEHDTVVIKNVDELMQADEEQDSSSVLQDDEYVVEAGSADVDTSNIDQIAAENLIFMARDGQVVSEIITNADATQADGDESIGDEYVYDPTAMDEYDEDTAPQMVTEEVITDDWVQRQGAERVEVPAEQIIGSSSQVIADDVEVPLPTVQDEYTALRPYPCDFCSRRFRKKVSLMNHMVAHQNDRPNLCKLCGSRFFRRSDLISHLKAHADAPEDEGGNEQIELGGFAIEDQKPEHSLDDDYYDYDDYMPANNKHNNRGTNKISNGNSNSCSATTTVRTGRISRLKPKKETFSLEMAEDVKHVPFIQHSIETNCQELQASTATVQFTQDKQNQHKFYPIIDDCKPFVCQQCGLSFAREKALSAHVKNHRNEAPLECDQCNEMFWDKDALQEHQKIHQFEASNSEYDPDEVEEETQSDSETEKLYGEFYCNECGISFHRQDILKRHARTHTHPNEVIETLDNKSGQHCCNTCGETFEEALDLLAHAEIHARYPPFKCVLCGESFFEEATIKRHLLTQHENVMTVNSCILCGKECRDRKALIKHAWDHSREKFHSCSKCGKSFHNKARLKRHMISHRDKSVTCNICFEEFPDGRSLSNHRHSHSSTSAVKMFPCLECGKTFGSRSSQQIHVRIHTGEKPYGCRYCWKAFADGGTLRKHERIHTGEKPYVCSVCSRAFNQRVVLREHIRSHHSGLDTRRGTYFCPLCEESLPSSPDLVQHLIQHSDVNTAKQRKPITGPRKYKRRRKLKPHELERLKSEMSKHNTDGNNSDVDITDIDMDNVDDLLAMTGESPPALPPANKRNKASKIKNENTKQNLKSAFNASSENCIVVDDVPSLSRTLHYHTTSSNADKLWPTKLNNDDSLLLNVENTLQTLDTLVVGTEQSNNKYNTTTPMENQAQRTMQVQLKRNERTSDNPFQATTTTTRTKRKTQTTSKAKTTQHTTKKATRSTQFNNINFNIENVNNSRQQRTTATSATATTTTSAQNLLIHVEPSTANISNTFKTLLPTKTLTIVDDYEIISPDTKPPHQISSSPIHIKHEETEHQRHQQQQNTQQHYRQTQFQQHKQQLLQQSNNNEQRGRRRRHLTSQSSQTSRSSDLYDAQLLLDAATLRKDCYEKFNPSIVQDLEEILRSPLKSDKISGERMRNNSECSTAQFISEHLEEEAALIKIEPNSPDFQSLFNCTPSGASGSVNNSNLNKTPERTIITRTTKNRQVTPNRRYLDFETSSPSTSASTSSSATRETTTRKVKQRAVRSNATSTSSEKSAFTRKTKTTMETSSTSPMHNFTSTTYTTQHNGTGVNHSNSSSLSNSYDSISTIDSAAAAVHAAEAAAANSKLQRNKFYFECEMCSMVFADRAQLLDHVPIHI